MITSEQAKKMFEEMIFSKRGEYQFEQMSEIVTDDPFYVMIAVDKNGNQVFPGEIFPSIRTRDGALIDYSFPETG